MASYLGWLDYSEADRRRALDVIHLFREQGTQDELGVGSIRDAFADMFFPGTSTVQTRARYFLFVPWIYLDLERLRTRSDCIARRARSREVALMKALSESDDTEGVIGIAAGAGLKRLPSSIYWYGLGVWGIRLFPGSQDQYHRSLDAFYASAAGALRYDDGEPVAGMVLRNWHAGVPPVPDGFPKNASLRLTPIEAEYLRERIVSSVPGSLLAFLVDRGAVFDRVKFPWDHGDRASFPPRLEEQLEEARNFSESIHGAALFYNLMLAERSGREDLVAEYRRGLEEWSQRLVERGDTLRRWDRERFWYVVASGGASVPYRTRDFVDRWLDMTLSCLSNERGPFSLVDERNARSLICNREVSLKGPRARLGNPRALELWSGRSGTAQLNYRWPVAQAIVLDIGEALRGGADHA